MPLPEEVLKNIRKYAIKNAIDYGRALPGNVLGRVARSVDKSQMAELKSEVDRAVKEVNKLSKPSLEKEYKPYDEEFKEQYEKKAEATSKPRMELEGAKKGDFVTRFAPEPSGYIHIGHASAAFLAQEFAKIYNGKAILYFDDTNPEKESQEFVDAIKKDIKWLGVEFEKEVYASDNMEKIYECAGKLLKSGKAYACECAPELIKKNRFEKIRCKHRDSKPEDSMKKFKSMLDGVYDEERIIIRIKGDMESDNTALRDPTIMRIKKHKHYRQGTKYIVWPTYDFNTPINDSINGITDAIRTKEYELRGDLYDMVLEYLEMRKPRMHLHGRIAIKGQPHQKREIRKLISEGYIKGFDDPRLVTIIALRRRGVQPEAVKEFVLSFGMSINNSTVELSKLLDRNQRIIDPIAKRLFYVPAPVDVKITNMNEVDVELDLHPSRNMGKRGYTVHNDFYISGADAAELKEGHLIKLKGLFCIQMKKDEDSWTGEPVRPESEDGIKKLQWVSDGNYVKCKVLVPGEVVDDDGKFLKDSLRDNEGYVENYATDLDEKEIVQFERFGFCILDDKRKMQFIFVSK